MVLEGIIKDVDRLKGIKVSQDTFSLEIPHFHNRNQLSKYYLLLYMV